MGGILGGSDGSGGFLNDPNTMSMLGLVAGLAKASGPSRLPVGFGQVLGSGLEGMAQFGGAAQQHQLSQLDIQQKELANKQNLWSMDIINQALAKRGMPGIGGQQGISPAAATNAALSQGGGPTQANGAAQTSMLSGNPSGSNGSGGGSGNPLDITGDPLTNSMILDRISKTAAGIYQKQMEPSNQRGGSYWRDPVSGQTQYFPALDKNVQPGPNGTVGVIPGALNATSALTSATSNAEQQARVDAEAKITQDRARVESGYSGGSGPPAPSGVMAPTVQSRTNPTTPQQPTVGPGGNILTPQGTVVPSPLRQTMGGMSVNELKGVDERSGKTQDAWNAARPNLESAETQLKALGEAFSTVQAGGLTTRRAAVANSLRGAGLGGVADQVMSQPETAAVQTALWSGMQDVLRSLKTINMGGGGRILASEFAAFESHAFDPNMDPNALHSAIVKQLGLTYQNRNLIDDWYSTAQPMKWRDANQYQSMYLKQNPIKNFEEYASKELPAFKGTPGAASSAPASQAKGAAHPDITPENLEYTAKQHGMTVDELKSVLRSRGFQVP